MYMYFSDAYRFNNIDVGFVLDSFIVGISYKIYIRDVAVAVVAIVSRALL